MENSMEIPLKTRNKTTIWPSNSTTGHIPWENHNKKRHMNIHPIFITAQFTIARTWKQPRCPSADEWIKKLWYTHTHTHNGILLSHKKKCIWVRSNEVDESRAYYTEWSKSERGKQLSYINTYIWALERWYRSTYLQGSSGDADTENRLVDTAREGEGGVHRESSTDICIFYRK